MQNQKLKNENLHSSLALLFLGIRLKNEKQMPPTPKWGSSTVVTTFGAFSSFLLSLIPRTRIHESEFCCFAVNMQDTEQKKGGKKKKDGKRAYLKNGRT
ncbi:conserved hypothetical protein [Ricinus communis]|uniref:Uncharacterized protein n=1 Tax=Ricinus communis TaxID=3988 RepID=B9S296_RICCO|nr:conserved hypothetical protein [Ricinus communis]